ncbi:MAG: hypothetical protein ACREQF_00245, partial [Candidatus Binataceae bacterium]
MFHQESLTPPARAISISRKFLAAVVALALVIAIGAGACKRAQPKVDPFAPQPEQKIKNPLEPT